MQAITTIGLDIAKSVFQANDQRRHRVRTGLLIYAMDDCRIYLSSIAWYPSGPGDAQGRLDVRASRRSAFKPAGFAGPSVNRQRERILSLRRT
jgi:hypothetical protein